MELGQEDLNRLVDDAVARTIKQYRKEQPIDCALKIDKESHAEEHKFIRGLMEVACKLEKIKWGFLGIVVKTIGGVLVAAMVIGLIVLAKQKMNDILPLP